ncbi:TetR/AcrR family transcriptional regulator [Glycomyces harbinensis]|uniref:Transcriptional regulator, TetR family n=1 Tax=Glycomyces harbinensis TaxID=58114 RepID=A0A1G6QSY4_9ACTN|nr:TetR/AcrR family transcriptional regulator [Glycomyces harbinensis]SDC95470.1 transcriptional regulator, TetR family [Glycomyces harbinensis]
MRSNPRTTGQSDAEPTFTEAARRAQILRHAIDVVADHGYAGASLNRIAEHAGISKGLISYHFAGKDDLLKAIVLDVFTRGGGFLYERETRKPATAGGALRSYLEGHLAFIGSHSREVGAVVEVVRNLRNDEGRLVYDNAWDAETYGELMGIFEAGQASGEFREFDPRVMAIAVRRVIDGFTFQVMGSPDVDVAAFTAEVVALFDHATTPRERS